MWCLKRFYEGFKGLPFCTILFSSSPRKFCFMYEMKICFIQEKREHFVYVNFNVLLAIMKLLEWAILKLLWIGCAVHLYITFVFSLSLPPVVKFASSSKHLCILFWKYPKRTVVNNNPQKSCFPRKACSWNSALDATIIRCSWKTKEFWTNIKWTSNNVIWKGQWNKSVIKCSLSPNTQVGGRLYGDFQPGLKFSTC